MRGGMQLGFMPRLHSHRTIDSDAFKESRGSGGWPPDQEKPPFLFWIDFLEKVVGQKESPRIVAWGLKDPCVINHFAGVNQWQQIRRRAYHQVQRLRLRKPISIGCFKRD